MNKSQKFSVLAHLDTSHCRKSDGKSKFYLKVRIAGQARLYDIQPELTMDKKFWVHEIDHETGKRKKRMRIHHAKANLNSKTLERHLAVKVDEMMAIIEDMLRKGNAPSHPSLSQLWKGSEARTFAEFIQWRIDEDSAGVKASTVSRWVSIQRCVQEFDRKVLLSDVSQEWLLRYEHYLRHDKPITRGSGREEKKAIARNFGMTNNTIVTRFGYLGKILAYAAKNDFVGRNPMDMFYADKATKKRMTYKRPERNVLEGAEIDRLHRAYVEKELIVMFKDAKPHLQEKALKYHQVLQQILVSIYTGFRFGDIAKFGEEGEVAVGMGRITLTMQKVDKRQTLKATDRLMEVLSLKTEGKLLSAPIYCNAHANKLLRKVLSLLGFTKHYSWHDLRRTFASYLQEKNVDIHKVSKLMGHSSVTTTERYVKVRDQDLDTAMEVWDEASESSPQPSPDDNGIVPELLEMIRLNPGIKLPEKLQKLVAEHLPNTSTNPALRVVG